MTIDEVAYFISEERKNRGIYKPDGNCTPEQWDMQMALTYKSTGETRRPEVWVRAFIGGI